MKVPQVSICTVNTIVDYMATNTHQENSITTINASMIRLLLFLPLIFGCINIHAQRIRFSDTTNTWKVRAGGKDFNSIPFSSSYHYYYRGDTIIQGIDYKRLASYEFRHSGGANAPLPDTYFIREDTVIGKVWSRSNRLYDTVEKLIYNAAWAMDDSVMFEKGYGDKFYINSIDSTQINGVWHKVFGLRTNRTGPGSNYAHVIEGLGTTAGPGFAFTGGLSLEGSYRLLCYYNKSLKPVLTPAVPGSMSSQSFSNTTACNLAVESFKADEAYISPNPITSQSRISLPQLLTKGELSILDASGRLLTTNAISETSNVALPAYNYLPGLYYYHITDLQTGLSLWGQFVFR
jgi:hypothetical protein